MRSRTLSSKSEPNIYKKTNDSASYVYDNNGVGYEICKFLGKVGFYKII